MPASRNRISRFLTDSRPPCDPVIHSLSNFYREEFLKCQRCLDQQREFYSEHAITEVEKALTRVMGQLDRLCAHADADWYSRSSGKYYCDACARQLNEACLAQGSRKVCELHF